jgi:Flp pilus assembly protein TadG
MILAIQRMLPGRLRSQRGVTAVMVGLLIVVLLGFAALAIDIGYALVARNELQNAADAAALAAARRLAEELVDGVSGIDTGRVIASAEAAASSNRAAGSAIALNPGDVTIGKWSGNAFSENPEGMPNAVRVRARREQGTAGGAISTFFARVIGIDSVDVGAVATAALYGPCGKPVPPLGISRAWFPADCRETIRFYPTSDANCAGWNTYNSRPANANKLADILSDLLACANDPRYPECPTNANERPFYAAQVGGDPLIYINGRVESAFDEMKALFEAMRVKNSGYDLDEDDATWTTFVPVYDWPNCNPSGAIPIAGFAKVIISAVKDQEGHVSEIVGQVVCSYEYEEGECAPFNAWNGPYLVQ